MATTGSHPATCDWLGASGTRYRFYVFPVPASFEAGQAGNYIYARRGPDRRWIPVYIGEGDLADRAGPSHHKARCIQRKGATHFHCHLNGGQEARRLEEADLLARYTNAFEPNGCNDRRR